jgi:K+-transporting ATPase ATPase A chain
VSPAVAAVLQIAVLAGLLAAVYRPLGDHLYVTVTSPRHLRVERVLYRVVGVDPDAEQRWSVYAVAVLAFSAVSVLLLYALLRLQAWLPMSLGYEAVPPDGAWNTAVSFVTNTNWQWYAGESTLGNLVQMAGLAVQNFLSAAVGIAVAVALARGFARSRTDRLGNFWVDLTRITVRVLLPISFVAALVLVLGGTVQSFAGIVEHTTLDGQDRSLLLGPVASQEAIKNLGTNGGGFYNANSGFPFENPQPWTNLLEIALLLAVPFALTRTFGRIVGDRRQGYVLAAVMAVIWLGSVVALTASELAGAGAAPEAAGAALEGKETRFGEAASALFAASTTATSTGSVNASHDSLTALGGGVAMLNMLLGEVAPGGVGAGLYGMLVLAVFALFLGGLVVGRTPEYLGKKIGRAQVAYVASYVLVMPVLVLVGVAITMGVESLRDASLQEAGSHGLSETLYAYASAANNNGSAFPGWTAATPYQNTALGLCMLLGRFLPIVLVLALAGSLGRRTPATPTPGTLPTHTATFAGLLGVVVLVLAGLTFLPVLSLGPLAEALS